MKGAEGNSVIVSDEDCRETYMAPEHGWACFHCGETFMFEHHARVHFGGTPDADPGCVLRMQPGEAPLLRKIRALEYRIGERDAELARFREEDGPKDRELAALRCDHAIALRDEEEKGYARGLADGRGMQEGAKQ